MDILQKQFQSEIEAQEMKSNRYTLKGFVWFILAVGFVWLLTILGFFVIDKLLISIVFGANAVLFVFAIWIGKKKNLSEPWVKYVLIFLICIGAAVIFSFLSYHAVFAFILPMLFAIQYRRRRVIWFAYIVNIVTMLISCYVSFYHGICDLNLLYESQNTRQWYLTQMAGGGFSPNCNENVGLIILVFQVFPQAIILLTFTIIIQYAMIHHNEDVNRIAQLTYQKEIDMGTGAFNNNKYKEMVSEYYPKIKNITVLFWDLNHLKKINDKYGHAIGDRVIQALAKTLVSRTDEHCRVFRIGGDEFLMILDYAEQNEADKVIHTILETLEKENDLILKEVQSDISLVSSAVGYASGQGKDILKIVKVADQNMYINKRNSKIR